MKLFDDHREEMIYLSAARGAIHLAMESIEKLLMRKNAAAPELKEKLDATVKVLMEEKTRLFNLLKGSGEDRAIR